MTPFRATSESLFVVTELASRETVPSHFIMSQAQQTPQSGDPMGNEPELTEKEVRLASMRLGRTAGNYPSKLRLYRGNIMI